MTNTNQTIKDVEIDLDDVFKGVARAYVGGRYVGMCYCRFLIIRKIMMFLKMKDSISKPEDTWHMDGNKVSLIITDTFE